MNPPGREAAPAFLFFGVFTAKEPLLAVVRQRIEEHYGPLHPRGESPLFPFPETRTYARTMGKVLVRKFFVLGRLWPQDGLASVKSWTVELEEAIRAEEGKAGPERPVNIDPGLLNDCRIILATTKDRAQRLYRGQGIWEEITLVYEGGAYRSLPWTYPDFRAPTYHEFFRGFREELLAYHRTHRA